MLLADKYHGGVPTDRRGHWHDYVPPPHEGVTRPSAFTRFHGYCANKVAGEYRRRAGDLSSSWREKSPRSVRIQSAELAYLAAIAQMFGMNLATNVWLVRGTAGSDANGGTSKTVQATGTDGVTNATNTLTSVSGLFTVGMVGQGINIIVGGVNQLRLVATYNSATSITFSGATIASASGRTWTIGGAWKTVANAIVNANSVAAGDSIYVGAGVYRATQNATLNGSSGSPISYIGDIDGAQTGDAGQVTLTAYTNTDRTAPSNQAVLGLTTATWLSFGFLTFIGGATSIINSTSSNGYTFTDCTFNALYYNAQSALTFTSGATGTSINTTFDRCVVMANDRVGITFNLQTTASGAGDWDALVVIRNSFVFAGGASSAVSVSGTNGLVHKPGGVRIYGSTLWGQNALVTATSSTTIPCEAHNCLLVGAAGLAAGVVGQITESDNLIYANTPYTNVTAGPGTVSNGSYAPLVELGQAFKWAGITRPFLAPDGASSPLLGFSVQSKAGVGASVERLLARSFAYPLPAVSSEGAPQPLMAPPAGPGWFAAPLLPLLAPGATGGQTVVPITSYDWANRPRPAGGGSNNPAAGYLEFHDSSVEDTGTTYSGAAASAKLTGPGDIDLLVPVDAVPNTFSIYCLYDSAYGGQTWPTLTLLSNGEIGVVSQVAQAGGAAWGTWQQITLNAFTPTAAGFVKIRLTSYDLSGASLCHWDQFAG